MQGGTLATLADLAQLCAGIRNDSACHFVTANLTLDYAGGVILSEGAAVTYADCEASSD